MKRIVPGLIAFLAAGSCTPHLPSAPDLFVDFEFIDAPTTPLDTSAKAVMNGVYGVIEGSDLLGPFVVGKWIGTRWCLFSRHDAVYAETGGGSSADSIKLTGYVRTVRSGAGARLRLKILGNEGAQHIVAGTAPPVLRIRGTTADGQGIVLQRTRALYDSAFHILAHRGGGRNSDRLGISENSIPMIEHAAALGATGIEIDVKRTRDNQIIVFHDDTFSPRTVQGVYLLGRVENFDLEQIRLFGRLVNGEHIPTLAEALTAVVDRTRLSLVWLDVKDPATMDRIIGIQREARTYAALKNRTVDFLIGIPSSETLRAYMESSFRDDSSFVLIELGAETALSLSTCKVWAPIWTRSITVGDVAAMHAAGKLVFTWTVDLRESIVNYLDRVDGILTNYPTLVSGIHHSKQ